MSVLRRVASRQPQHAAMRLLARWQSATASAEAATIPPAAADKSGPGSGALLVGALTLLGGYIWHSREGNIAHDALVEQLAAESVLCPGEVTTLRSKNKVTHAMFRKIVERCHEYFPQGTATFAQFAWVVHDTLKESHPEGLHGHHHLERAVVLMQQAYEEAFHAEMLAHSDVPSNAENESKPSDDSDAKDEQPEPSPAKAVQVDLHAGNNPQPLPVQRLLTLYSVCCGGVAEDRVDLLFDLYRDTHPSMRSTTPQELGKRAALDMLGRAEDASPPSDAAWSPPTPAVTEDGFEALTREQLLGLVAGVRDTYQLPARQCVSEVARYPTPQWRRKSAEEHLANAAGDRKLSDEAMASGVFDRDTVEDLLFAKGICIWAECYNEVR